MRLCNAECTDNRPPGVTLLRREKPSRQYGGHHSGKLCPLKRARWGEDVTVKTCNPNENQIQSACSSENLCSGKRIAMLQLPIADKRGEVHLMRGAEATAVIWASSLTSGENFSYNPFMS